LDDGRSNARLPKKPCGKSYQNVTKVLHDTISENPGKKS
jgi:hypothetical protein